VQRLAGGLAEEAPEDVEGQSADVGKGLSVVPEEHAKDFGYRPDELTVTKFLNSLS
jgi:hypothetical protein